MKEQLTHILDQSVCLSRKQMKEYLSGSMLPEEVHAAEVHISSCPLCSMAMEGFQEHSDSALAAIASLNSGFLKEHFDNIAPQIHLNSMAPAASMSNAGSRRVSSGAWVRPAGIAAALLLICATAWYLATRSNDSAGVSESITMTSDSPVSAPQDQMAENAANPLVASPQEPAIPAAGPATSAAADAPATAARKTTAAADKSDSHDVQATSGVARYYQPEVIPTEDPATGGKTPETILPSANDASKTYQGDISVRTMKVYVPTADAAEGSRPAEAAKAAVANRPAPPKTPEIAESRATPPTVKRTDESADQLYERGEYRSALGKYRQQLKSSNPDVRSHSSLQAARCYAALGESGKAEELLRKVMDDGNGRDRRTARKLLRNLR